MMSSTKVWSCVTVVLVACTLVVIVDAMRIEQLIDIHKDATSITIEWRTNPPTSSSSSNGGSSESNTADWIGFKIKYFTDKLQYPPVLLKNLNLRKFRLDNLKSNTEYRIQVSAYSARETEGPASELLVVRTAEAVPGEPQEFRAVRVTSNSIDLEWKAPKRDEQSASSNNIKGYEIHYFKVNQSTSSSSSGSSSSEWDPSSSLLSSSVNGATSSSSQQQQQETPIFKRKTNDVNKLKYTLTDLEPNTFYKIQIFAYNKRGDGQRSSPLFVSTLDEGPSRPLNIRSEIHNDVLTISWDPPAPSSSASSSSSSTRIDGYLVYFEREKFELDAKTTQIKFQRPKWDYDRQYEFKIAAKSGASSSSSSSSSMNRTAAIYGQEAIYHISTHTNQSKIVIHLEKLTSRSVLIRWNPVQLSSGHHQQRVVYKLEYWAKSESDRVYTHDRLNATELQLSQLAPSTDYIVQLVAMGTHAPTTTSEMATKHFRTLANDLDAPQNVQAVRFQPDKISIKWERGAASMGVQTYRIYFREINNPNDEDDEPTPNYDLEESDEWKLIDQSADLATEIVLEDLSIESDYAIKLAAVDGANNEGPFSAVKILYHTKSPSINDPYSPGLVESLSGSSSRGGGSSSSSGNDRQLTINERVGIPRDVEVVEFAKSAKFSWLPPAAHLVGPYPIRSFIISYADRPKLYRDTNGSLVTFHKGLTMAIGVPAKEDGVSRITWMVSALEPFTEYDFNVSAVAYSPQLGEDVLSPPHRGRFKTRPARPTRVDAPRISQVYADNTVLVKLGNASALHGPITKYWLVIVPIDPLHRDARHSSPSGTSSIGIHQPNMQAELADLQTLLKYSLQNTSTSNESAYITAEFAAEYWPAEFIVGIGESVRYGRFVNRRLSSTVDYKAFIVAFAQENTNETAKPANMILLADVLPGRTGAAASSSPLGGVAAASSVAVAQAAASPLLLESDLFTFSSYSETFNTRLFDSFPDRHASSAHGAGGIELYNVFWVIGAVVAFIAIVAMVIFLSINFMQKRSKLNQAAAAGQNGHQQQQQQQRLLMNGNGGGHSNTLMRQQQQANGVVVTTNSGNMSATSSTSTTANLMGGGGGGGSSTRTMETHLTKNGHIQTTLLRSAMQNNSQKSSSISQMFELTQQAASAANAQPVISSSSSSSSTTASPTTALLSCSVNNHHHRDNNQNSGSQSSSNTNTTNTNNTQVGGMLAAVNGLLTTASPLKNGGGFGMNGPIQESLYTSIEVTQKLLQQQQLNAVNNPLGSNQYDNHMMMIMNNAASGGILHNTTNPNSTFNGIGTLSRSVNSASSAAHRALSQQQFSLPPHYDPIEYRRIHYPTPALASHPPIHIDELFQQLERLKAHTNALFSLEYESIEPGQQFTWETAITDVNRQKNRYANVIAYDHSRVILSRLNAGIVGLSGGGDDLLNSSDYINASFCDGHRKSSAYIATQGPLPSTYGDFWRMVWEQGSSTIVMMTKLEERQRLKCDQYWPSKGTEVFDNCMQVSLVDHTELAAYSIRTFVIAPVNTYAQMQISANSHNMNFEMRREVKHFQFTAWPDHGVPDHPTQFLMFVRRVRQANPVDAGPVVVHCSAGVGRTGCYIVIDTMLERIRSGEKTIDIYGHVTCLRSQRNYMVQTEEQYIFCYDAVLEASQSGPTDVPAPMLYAHLQRLLQPASSALSSTLLGDSHIGGESVTPLTEMEIEYKRLSNIKAPQSKFHAANLPANKFKNRLVNILPYEATRVVLQCLPNQPESAGTDYINANFIDGYKYRRAYIATQAPLQETIDDFWRMLWEHNSTIVVMLTKLREMGREKCAQYWPVERSIRYQYFVVDPVAEYNMSSYILREFKVTDARDGQSRTVRQFQFVDWPEQGVPKSGESIIDLIGQVHRTKEQFGQVGPITVHCSAGVGRTGVFITLSIALERMRYEDHVDIYNSVKLLRTQRPAMVQTEDQYQFCYRAILEYLGTFE